MKSITVFIHQLALKIQLPGANHPKTRALIHGRKCVDIKHMY